MENPAVEKFVPNLLPLKEADSFQVDHQKDIPDEDSLTQSTCTVSANSSSGIVHMKKRIGLGGGVAMIVGTMIGSGIFISPSGVLAGSGSIGLSLIIWMACGLISLCGALVYAELGTLITKSGAEYAYLLEGGKCLPQQLAPIPAYLFAWISVFVLKPALFGVIALSFGIYSVESLFGHCHVPDSLIKLMAILCMLLVAFVNCYSVRLANKVQIVFTVAKLLAIGIIVTGGLVFILCGGGLEYLSKPFENTSSDLAGIALAFYDGLWAYDGWNNLNYATEELQNPTVNLPRAILIAIPLVTVCYVLTNLSFFTVMSRQAMLMSPAVAATWGSRVLGSAAIIIPISVAMSTFGAANGSCFSGCRLPAVVPVISDDTMDLSVNRLAYAAARDHHLPEMLSYVHIRKCTPLPSVVFSTVMAIVLILPGNIYSLIDLFSFTAWIFYGATMACLLIFRYTRPHDPRPFRVPTFIPVVMIVVSLYLVVIPIALNPHIEFLYAILFVLSGMVFYIPFISYRLRLTFLDPVVRYIQLALEVVPSAYLPPE